MIHGTHMVDESDHLRKPWVLGQNVSSSAVTAAGATLVFSTSPPMLYILRLPFYGTSCIAPVLVPLRQEMFSGPLYDTLRTFCEMQSY